MSTASLLAHAAKTGDLDTLRQLVERSDNDVQFYDPDAFNTTPFQHACHNGHPRVAQYLLQLYKQHDMDVTGLDVCQRKCPNPELVKFVQGKQTIDDSVARDTIANLSVWDAAKGGHVTRLRDLVQLRKMAPCQNPPVHLADADNHTALYYACLGNHVEGFAVLVPAFKAAMDDAEYAVEMEVCRKVATTPTAIGLLDGSLMMRDLFAPPAGSKSTKKNAK
ncbi:Aste57867_1661 [Aphanomyces stellatus]|uniref:Aste57867_1661 protein n=1 Tax=Aphanomyces stellatus TaxID=120398 RepID=A0A485KB64_9STRA|nr:hypothetical protein As57867_001659 [Aphanomyces stellatus]VFT78873.1 Aste57867_1661 [Aphanomyces stellatus]